VTSHSQRGYSKTRFGQLHFLEAGDGPTLVLLPAASQSHNDLRKLIAYLAPRFRIFAVDALGSGYSDPLPNDATIEKLAEALRDFYDAQGVDRAHLYGIHTGNKVAAAFAARFPKSLDGLVLCGQTHSLLMGKEARAVQMRRVSQHHFTSDISNPVLRDARRWAQLWAEVDQLRWGSELFNGNFGSAAASIKARIIDRLLSSDSMVQLYRANFDYDFEHDVRRISVPTMVVEIATPAEDVAIGRQGAAMVDRLADGCLVTLEEPDGLGLTLEGRAEELGRHIEQFAARTSPCHSQRITQATDPEELK
jgi:pimeloyl-ACP methyl ester carboxylesterase